MTFHERMGPHAPHLCASGQEIIAPKRRDAGDFVAPKRRDGGPYGWMTPYLAAIAGQNASVAARVLSLPRDEVHFIAIALSLMGEARDEAPRLDAFARDLGRLNREEILRAHAPAADPRVARFCGKLAGGAWRARTYLRFAELLAEPNARKTFQHLPAVTRRSVIALWRLPAAYRTRGVLKMLKQPAHLPRTLFAIEIVRRVRTDLTDRQILASLERADSWSTRKWVEAHYRRLPFPKPPVGTLTDGRGGVLSPIISGDELRRTAIEFWNCIDDYLLQSHRGVCVFYRYDVAGKRVAIVEICKLPGVGWAIWEMSGPKDQPVSGEDKARIVETFAAAGVSAAPQALTRWRKIDLGWLGGV